MLMSLLSHLLNKGHKSATVGLEMLSGSLRQVKDKVPFSHPKEVAKSSNLSYCTFIGTMKDLSKFTLRPANSPNLLSKSLRKSYLIIVSL